MRTLVIYYSLTGHTRTVATDLSKSLGATLAEITCPAYARGLSGGLRQAWHILRGASPEIVVPEVADTTYDLVVAAGPVWAGRPAPPLRAYLKRYAHKGTPLALVVTCGGTSRRFSGDKALEEAGRVAPRRPIATLLVKEAELEDGTATTHVLDFVDKLKSLNRPHAAE